MGGASDFGRGNLLAVHATSISWSSDVGGQMVKGLRGRGCFWDSVGGVQVYCTHCSNSCNSLSLSLALSLTSSNVYVFTIFPFWKTVCSRSWRWTEKQDRWQGQFWWDECTWIYARYKRSTHCAILLEVTLALFQCHKFSVLCTVQRQTAFLWSLVGVCYWVFEHIDLKHRNPNASNKLQNLFFPLQL